MPNDTLKEPSLQEQTMEIGRMLKTISEENPSGTPSAGATAVFVGWLALAGPTSREPAYLDDVAKNYVVAENSNKDLWEIFDILENYIEVEDEEPPPPRTFIGLPLAPG